MTDKQTIDAFANTYAAAFVDGDPEGILALLTDDFVALTADKPPIAGRDAIRAEIESDLSIMDVKELRFENHEVQRCDEWAFAWGFSEAKIQVGDDLIEVSGKYLWVLKNVDGHWRLARDSASANG